MCYLYKVDDFDGYGFNLCKIKEREGQFISNIELGSPANRGGLREGDRLVEVNGENIETKSHKKVVKRIKELKGEVSLLLVDPACDNYLRKEKIKLSGKYQEVVVIHSSKSEELLDDVDVNQFNTTEVQSITLKIEDIQEEDEREENNDCFEENQVLEEELKPVTMRDLGYEDDVKSESHEPLLDVVTISFSDKSAGEATAEKMEEPILDNVTVTFEDISDEEKAAEKTDGPIMDVVTVTFEDKSVEENAEEETDEPILDAVAVSFNDESVEETSEAITTEPFMDVVTVTFGDISSEETSGEKMEELILDVVTVSFGEKSGEEVTEEKTEEPLIDIVTVSFGDKTGEETTEEKIEEPLMDIVTVSFGDKSGEVATKEPILDVETVRFGAGDKTAEEATEVEESDLRKEDNVKMTTTLVTWGQRDVEKHDILDIERDIDSIIKVNEDWKLTKDELDAEEAFEKDEDSDLPKSVSTSSFHSLSEDEVTLKF